MFLPISQNCQVASLVISYLILLGGTFNGLILYELNTFSLALIALVGAAWFVWRMHARREFLHTALDLPIAALLFAYLAATIFSVDPRRSLITLFQMLLAALVFYLVVDLLRAGWPAELFIKVLILTSGFILFFGVRELVLWYQGWAAISHFETLLPPATYRLRAFLGHPNFVAAYFNLLLPLGLVRALQTSKRMLRVGLGLWSLLVLVMVYFTSSRGGWLGTAAALGSLCILLLLQFRSRIPRYINGLRYKKPLIVLAVGAGIVLVAGLFLLLRWQSQHPSHPTSGGNILGSRTYIWQVAGDMFQQNWLVGNGPFTFGTEYIAWYSVPPEVLLAHAHNYFINVVAEAGLIGLSALLLVMFVLARTAWRIWRNGDAAAGLQNIGLMAALGGFAVHSLFDTPQSIPLFLLLSALLVALLVAQEKPIQQTHPQIWRNAVLGLAGLVVVFGLGWSVWAYRPFVRGIEAANQLRWSEAAGYFNEAVRRDPGNALYWQQAGFAHGQAALGDDVQGENAQELAQAIAAFERGVSIEPTYAQNWVNLGVLYQAAGDEARAQDAFVRAVEQAPKSTTALLVLARYYENVAAESQAAALFTRILALQPKWAVSDFFHRTDLRQQVAAHWLADQAFTALSDDPLGRGWDAFAKQDYPQAEVYFEQALGVNTPEAYLGLGRSQLALGNMDGALAALQTAAFIGGDRGELKARISLALGEAHNRRGDCAAAVSAYENALALMDHSNSTGIGRLGSSDYAWYVFNRASAAADTLPGVEVVVYSDDVVFGMLSLADCYHTLGDVEAEQALYARILEVAPGNRAAADKLDD